MNFAFGHNSVRLTLLLMLTLLAMSTLAGAPSQGQSTELGNQRTEAEVISLLETKPDEALLYIIYGGNSTRDRQWYELTIDLSAARVSKVSSVDQAPLVRDVDGDTLYEAKVSSIGKNNEAGKVTLLYKGKYFSVDARTLYPSILIGSTQVVDVHNNYEKVICSLNGIRNGALEWLELGNLSFLGPSFSRVVRFDPDSRVAYWSGKNVHYKFDIVRGEYEYVNLSPVSYLWGTYSMDSGIATVETGLPDSVLYDVTSSGLIFSNRELNMVEVRSRSAPSTVLSRVDLDESLGKVVHVHSFQDGILIVQSRSLSFCDNQLKCGVRLSFEEFMRGDESQLR